MIRSTIKPIGVALAIITCAAAAYAGGAAIWSYEGRSGPAHWGELARSWAVCGNGRYQSPIDLSNPIAAELGRLSADIKATNLSFGLDGPTFAVPYEPGSKLTIHDVTYELKQFHFHHQSEHTVNGKHYPMEAHLVMQSEGGQHADAVLGIFIEAGEKNAMLDQFWGQLPRARGKKVEPVPVNIGQLIPKNTAYYMYEGSMTTPGCPEGVRWFVLENPVQASQAQIDRFITDFSAGDTNNRPVQPLHGRVVLMGK